MQTPNIALAPSYEAWGRWFMPAALCAAALAIAVGVIAPHDPMIRFTHGMDKLEHFGAFFLLACLTLWRGRAGVLKFIILAEAAAAIEVVQGLFIPTRTASLDDFIWSFVGAACGALVVWGARRATGLRANRRV